jgi:hypothetical protein
MFALLYVMTNLLRPEASLVPQSSTAGTHPTHAHTTLSSLSVSHLSLSSLSLSLSLSLSSGPRAHSRSNTRTGSNAWNHHELRGICRVNKLLPAGRLPIANHSPNKGLERQRRRAAKPHTRRRTIQAGNGGRGADPPRVLSRDWANRNDPAVITARAKLYKVLRDFYGEACAAEELWPASPSKPEDYTEIPILSYDYNMGYAEKFPEF